jgi:predicted lipid-binding transport protein (Tim44 family)
MARLNWKKGLRQCLMLLLLVGIALLATDAFARPGGGSGYSGGGGSSGGGFSGGGFSGGSSSSDSDGDLIGVLIWLLIEHPQIGVPLVILFIMIGVVRRLRKPKTAISSVPPPAEKVNRVRAAENKLKAVRQDDANFSHTLFLDFVQHLYYQVHHLGGKPEFNHLRPYISPSFFQEMLNTASPQTEITEVVIGSADVVHVERNQEWETLTVEFDANYTSTTGKYSLRYWSLSRWTFNRKRGLQSPGPEAMRNPGCPSCGSPLETTPAGECIHCGTTVVPGSLTWELVAIRTIKREQQKGVQFGGYAEERGTDLPTVRDSSLDADTEEFLKRHGLLNQRADYWKTLRSKVIEPIFTEIYVSWSQNDWERARPLMTDNLFRSHHWWINQYKKAGVTNKLDDLRITNVIPARLDTDKFYETLTVRIYASVKDYTVDKSGKLIGGSNIKPRLFSEYWTFIRRTGVEKKESDFNPANCPNCGSPVKMGMAGICPACNAKVTSGDFGWVLSRITQDDVYIG